MICRKVAVSVLGNGHHNSEYVVVSFRMMGYVIHNSQVIGASISLSRNEVTSLQVVLGLKRKKVPQL